jgi:hypothetical protein
MFTTRDARIAHRIAGEPHVFSKSLILRFIGSFSYLFFSLILGLVAMGLFWFYFPGEFVQLQRSSSTVREWIVGRPWSARTESIIRFLLEDRQLLLISFVLAVRIFLGVLVLPFRALFGRG